MFMKSSYKSSWRIGFSSVFLLIIFSITNNLQHDALSKEINLTINPQNTLHRIDPKLYSHFLEHIYNSCNGGLWGELIWNRSLEAGKASEWSFTGFSSLIFSPLTLCVKKALSLPILS